MISIEQKQTTENPVYTKKEIEEIVKLVVWNYITEVCIADPGLLRNYWKNIMVSTHCHLKVLLGVYYHAMV